MLGEGSEQRSSLPSERQRAGALGAVNLSCCPSQGAGRNRPRGALNSRLSAQRRGCDCYLNIDVQVGRPIQRDADGVVQLGAGSPRRRRPGSLRCGFRPLSIYPPSAPLPRE